MQNDDPPPNPAGVEEQVPPRLTLSVEAGPARHGTVLEASGFRHTIGRTRKSDLRIKDMTVSKRHAVVSWAGTAWVVHDLGSSNGTRVNGRRLQPMVNWTVISDGDVILFGSKSKCVVLLTARTMESMTVGELLGSYVEATAHRIEMHGMDQAKALLTELSEATAKLKARLAMSMSTD